jgi:hypothetical protein
MYARMITGCSEGGVFEQEKVQCSAATAKGSPLGMEEALAAAKGATLARRPDAPLAARVIMPEGGHLVSGSLRRKLERLRARS